MFLSFLGLGWGLDDEPAETGPGGFCEIIRTAFTCVYSSVFTKHNHRCYLPRCSFRLCNLGILSPISQKGKYLRQGGAADLRLVLQRALFWIHCGLETLKSRLAGNTI